MVQAGQRKKEGWERRKMTEIKEMKVYPIQK